MSSAVGSRGFLQWQIGAFLLVSFPLLRGGQAAQIRYSIPEELVPGAFVGDVARDLGLDAARVASRQLQILPGLAQRHFRAEAQSGILVVEEWIDRERLCGSSPRCLLYRELLLANPLGSHRVEVEILDVNDNTPAFLTSLTRLEIAESSAPDARFPLERAEDLDFGANSVSTYRLSPPGCFTLNVKNPKDCSKHPELGTVVIKLNATDQDEGTNGEITYSFSSHARQKIRRLFSIQDRTGEVRVLGNVDYEDGTVYEVDVRAKDQGSPSMDAHCSVLVEITDVNYNAPRIRFTSFSAAVREDAPAGTAVALLSISDGDSKENGEVQLQLPADIPFQIVPSFRSHYSLVTSGLLDREEVSEYKIVITATDSGSPPLSSQSSLLINISDLNDNPPRFFQPAYQAESIVDSTVQGVPVSSYVYVGSENGTIYSSSSFDQEQIKQIAVQIQARDGGSPPLSTNVTVSIFILGQNDNAPLIIYPVAQKGFLAQQSVPFSSQAGHLVTKVTAVDVDSGRNSGLSYKLQRATDPSLFKVCPYTGEIRTTRALLDQDPPTQKIVLVVEDAGEAPMSTTTTVIMNIEQDPDRSSADFRKSNLEQDGLPHLTVYLIIALALISVLSAMACYF
ncbi:unnamed protein product [Caretta caretta]